MNPLKTPSFFSLLLLIALPQMLFAQLDAWDSDQDAMPNGWEYHRGLDVNDPGDAWQDPDQDGICNLFEYFLGAHPQDPLQPAVINYSGKEPLEAVIRRAPRGSVLRIPEGEYALNYLYETFSEAPRLMIQGGWNADFTERDYCRYPTVLDGGKNGAIFNFLIASGNSAAVVLDGLTLKNASRGAVDFVGYLAKAQLMLANCTLVENEAGRFSSIVHFEEGGSTLLSDFIMVNTTVTDNKGTGIRMLQHANWTNCKILHSLIAFNDYAENDAGALASGYGLSYRPASDSLLHVQVSNSILWGNANADVRFDNQEGRAVEVDSRFNLYGRVEADSASGPFFSKYDRSQNPLLVKDAAGRYYLEERSPARGAGRSIGFTEEASPDVGILSCAGRLSTSVEASVAVTEKMELYPNPASDELFIEAALNEAGPVRFRIYNALGQLQLTPAVERRPPGRQLFSFPVNALQTGVYVVELVSGPGRAPGDGSRVFRDVFVKN